MLVEIHMLKNFQPTNLNRDDTGAPKTCMFGGVQRGRISSQCLKHSWRKSEFFKEAVDKNRLSIRTRKFSELIEEALRERDVKEEYINILKNNKAMHTEQIIVYCPEDIQEIASYIKERLDKCKTNKEVEKISAKDILDTMETCSKKSLTLDMALFGRMVTHKALANVEASMQVAHAISTNKVYMESDYFTAIDDLIAGSETESGSALIMDADYNSSCYYIYASLDTKKLRENLQFCEDVDDIMKKIVPVLLETMTMTNPSGKQNSFAGHSLPSAILVECKDKHIPVSYANAFEVPVKPDRERGLVYNSIVRLQQECSEIASDFGIPVTKRLWFSREPSIVFEDETTVNCRTFRDLLAQLPQM